MFRGIDGRDIFVDSADRCRFLLFLQEASELHKFRVHAFCLMSNHIHLLLESLNDNLALGVHRFAMRYAQQFNRRHKKRGYVFQGRFRSILVEGECYMRRLTRYIHLNPLEAGLAIKPEDYRWSSYNAYFGLSAFAWLETDRILHYFGPTRKSALTALAEFMEAKEEASIDQREIERAVRSGIYGNEEFKRSFVFTDCSKKPSAKKSCTLESLIQAVCGRFCVTSERLYGSEKSRQYVDARATFARMVQMIHGFSLGDVCKVLGKHHSTISRLAKKCVKCPKLHAIAEELVQALS